MSDFFIQLAHPNRLNQIGEAIIILVVLTNLGLLGTSRVQACIRAVAIQGILLGILPLVSQAGEITVRLLLLAAASTAIKGVAFPWLLTRSMRDTDQRREVEPFVGYTTSMLCAVALIGVSIYLGGRLPMFGSISPLMAPVAIFTLMVGLMVIISRKKAMTQVVGYLAMENGIYTFGMALATEQPLLVELGILLDVFMAVFVMGIMIYHINRELDHIDTDRMSALRD